MNHTTTFAALLLSVLLFSCGNKGDLYLEADEVVAEELKQLDVSLDELDEDAIEKARKKAQSNSQSTN